MKPLVTLILLTYNQEDFIQSAIKSVLNQDYENIEIIVSDDCSTDETFKKASEVVKSNSSRKAINLNRNERNLGLTAHFNKLLEMANGEIIVVAAGDDISLPTRVTKSVEILLEHEDVTFVSFNDELIDSKGMVLSTGERVNFNGLRKFDLKDYLNEVKIPLSGASRAFRKVVYDYFGGLNSDCPTEDTPYILRGLLIGKTAISSDIAIQYRRHNNNLSNPSSIANMDIDTIMNQYKTDLRTAYDKKGISEEKKAEVSAWIKRNHTKRNKLNQLHMSNSKLTYFLENIALEKSIHTIDKLKLLAVILRATLVKTINV